MSVGLLAAHAAVAADELFQGRDSAIGIDRADHHQIAGMGEVHHPPFATCALDGAVAVRLGSSGAHLQWSVRSPTSVRAAGSGRPVFCRLRNRTPS
jgi:hypothetical protein